MNRSGLRSVPSVDRVLRELGVTELPRPLIVRIVRREIDALRKGEEIPAPAQVLSRIREAVEALASLRIRPLINGTGILVHTNFGRAPLGPLVIERLSTIASSYNNLEYGALSGGRGSRAGYLEEGLAVLCDSEAATVVNNNAAALVLIVRHLCGSARPSDAGPSHSGSDKTVRDEVIISRGELIQIGGGFRVPEILESSGARLREIGTTNKTSLDDYDRAISPRTAMILKVHRSNFFMDGFVESPRTAEIATLSRRYKVPFIEDLGSGAMVETERVAQGLEHEPIPREALGHGVDLICFSGDKLLGGPQAGVIAGKAKWVAALKREPLFRALRCDKLVLSALEATVDLYLTESKVRPSHAGAGGSESIRVIEMMRLTNEELLERAQAIVSALRDAGVTAVVGEGHSQIGGGTLPRSEILSVTLDLSHPTLKPQEIAERLRTRAIPVVGYVSRGTFKIDLRTVFRPQDEELVKAICEVCNRGVV